MIYKKNYNKKNLLEQITESGKKTFNIEDLLFEIGFDMKDINKFYVTHVKHKLRYEDRR